jgi:hypothetical protein
MISHVKGSSASLMIGLAAFVAAGGMVIWLLARRKGNRGTGWVLLAALPGLYIAFLPLLGEPKWLYIPGLTLLAVSYLLQFAIWRRERSDASRDDTPPDPSGSARNGHAPRF